MPHFPGMGYPLVPGYESVGRVVEAGPQPGGCAGERVFVPGARCFGDVRGLFGGAASRVVVPGARVMPVDERWGERAVLLALAATALARGGAPAREPVAARPDRRPRRARPAARAPRRVGGRAPPTVWERDARAARVPRATPWSAPRRRPRRDYRASTTSAATPALLDTLIAAPGAGRRDRAGRLLQRAAQLLLPARLHARGAHPRRRRMARADLLASRADRSTGALSLDGLITHRESAAGDAYRTPSSDPACLKMVLDWRRTLMNAPTAPTVRCASSEPGRELRAEAAIEPDPVTPGP
jgi:bacteriochlorophyllide a dehydrogenase